MHDGYQVGFAQIRLTILDLSALGHQPMHSVNKRVFVVYNNSSSIVVRATKYGGLEEGNEYIVYGFFCFRLGYTFILQILFYKSSKSFYNEYLSLQSGNMLRGLFALVIVYHHLAQSTTEGLLFQLFTHAGYLVVAVFFFFSGYGLQKKYIADETYSHQFLLRRLLTVLIPYIIMNFIYWLWNGVNGTFYSLKYILKTLVNGSPFVKKSWYIICILLFYIVFYVLMRICKRHYVWMISGACLYNLIWIIICHSLSYGTWWYSTSHLLIVGMIWATWEDEITEILKKYYIVFTSIAGGYFYC